MIQEWSIIQGIIEFLWGLGLFLFGITFFEKAVSEFAKRWFKKMIKKWTSNNFASFITGLLSTMILESSNLVSVLVLSFVWAWILSLIQALSVMLWANVWTTIISAIFWSVGMSYDTKMVMFPLLLIWAIILFLFKKKEKLSKIGNVIIGLSLIFLALDHIKCGVMDLTNYIDLGAFCDMPVIVFFFIGLLLTSLIQSGTAIFIITLTSLSTNLISLDAWLWILLWCYLGSTITIVLASLWWTAIKKQVATWHVGFNIFVVLMGLSTIPLIRALFNEILIPHFWLIPSFTWFYVSFRALCALIVMPFIPKISKLFKKYITDKEQGFMLSIEKIEQPIDEDIAFIAIKQDILFYLKKIINYNLNIWDFYITEVKKKEKSDQELLSESLDLEKNDLKNTYLNLKNIQDSLLNFLLLLNQNNNQTVDEIEKNNILYQVIVGIGDSSKSLKDVSDIIDDWKWSTSEILQQDYKTMRKIVLDFYKELLEVLVNLDDQNAKEMLHILLEKIQKNDKKYIKMFKIEWTDVKLANLIQVNRSFSISCISLVNAIEKIELNKEEKKYMKEYF